MSIRFVTIHVNSTLQKVSLKGHKRKICVTQNCPPIHHLNNTHINKVCMFMCTHCYKVLWIVRNRYMYLYLYSTMYVHVCMYLRMYVCVDVSSPEAKGVLIQRFPLTNRKESILPVGIELVCEYGHSTIRMYTYCTYMH